MKKLKQKSTKQKSKLLSKKEEDTAITVDMFEEDDFDMDLGAQCPCRDSSHNETDAVEMNADIDTEMDPEMDADTVYPSADPG